MPLSIPKAQNPVDPRILSFLTRILGQKRGKGLEDALASLTLAPTPIGGAIKGPELGAEATAGLSDEELDILGDLLGTGGGAPAAVGKKATDRFAKIASQVGAQPEGAKALEAAKAQAAAAGRPVETEVPKLLRPKGGSKAAKEAFESQSGGAIHDLLSKLRQSDKQVRQLQLQHAQELAERLGLPVDQVLSMLRNPSRE